MTIFLNPLQFGVGEDLAKYPRTLDADLELLAAEGADLVFAPAPDAVYPDGDPGIRVSAGALGDVLEGASRPGHFDGVLTVVAKLLHLARPRPRLLRAEGRPAAAADPADGARPRLPHRGRGRPHRARAGRPGDEQPQHVPHRLRPRGGADAVPRPRRGSRRPRGRAPARCAGPPATSWSPSRCAASTTSRWCTRPRSTTCPEWYSGEALLAVAARVGLDPPDRQRPARARGPDHRSRSMMRTMMHGKIHRATVTQADLHYVGLDDDRRRPAGGRAPAARRADRRRRRHQRRAADDLHDRGRARRPARSASTAPQRTSSTPATSSSSSATRSSTTARPASTAPTSSSSTPATRSSRSGTTPATSPTGSG